MISCGCGDGVFCLGVELFAMWFLRGGGPPLLGVRVCVRTAALRSGPLGVFAWVCGSQNLLFVGEPPLNRSR